MRFTQQGIAVANITIAHTTRSWSRDENKMVDGDTLFMRCSVWREQAEHVAESLRKGSRVVALVVLKQESYTDKDTGKERTVVVGTVVEIGTSLAFHVATPVAKSRTQKPAAAPAQQSDPWATAPAEDEPPF